LDRRQRNAIIRHNFGFSWLSFVLVSLLLKPPQEKTGATPKAFFPTGAGSCFSGRTRHVGALFSAYLAVLGDHCWSLL
jgi:hypothetical protein